MDNRLGRVGSLCLWNRLPQFPVRLTVQLVSFDEHRSTLFCRVEKYKVGRNALVLLHFDYMSDLDILGRNWLHLVVSLPDDFIRGTVQILVTGPPGDIVNCLFSHCHEQHECQRRYVCEQESDFQEGNELREGDAEEEEVEEELELVDEHHGDERDDVVFLVVQSVRWERCGQGVSGALQFSFL